MRATLTFDDNETEELRRSLDGPLAFDVLFDVDQHLRQTLKHGPVNGAVSEALLGVRDYLHTSAAEHGISIDA